jgi:hypothetical protein
VESLVMESNHRNEYELLKALVMDEWDPIGVKEIAEAAGEYDTYIYDLLGLVFRSASESDFFNYLWKLETGHMGLSGDRAVTIRFAKRLSELKF